MILRKRKSKFAECLHRKVLQLGISKCSMLHKLHLSLVHQCYFFGLSLIVGRTALLLQFFAFSP